MHPAGRVTAPRSRVPVDGDALQVGVARAATAGQRRETKIGASVERVDSLTLDPRRNARRRQRRHRRRSSCSSCGSFL